MPKVSLLALLGLVGVAVGCGPAGGSSEPVVAPVATPDAVAKPDASAQVTSSSQACAPGPASAAILGLDAQTRSELASTLAAGVAVVSYDCTSLKVLASCMVDARYDFVGVPRMDTHRVLKSRDEALAAIPLWGTPLRFEPGDTMALDQTIVGQRKASIERVQKKDLRGGCDGATHFVRSAHVGAFQLTQQSGPGPHQRAMAINDGDLSSCQSATADRAPAQCQSVLSVDLVPLSK